MFYKAKTSGHCGLWIFSDFQNHIFSKQMNGKNALAVENPLRFSYPINFLYIQHFAVCKQLRNRHKRKSRP